MIKVTDTHWIREDHVSEVHLTTSGGPAGDWAIDVIMQSGERFCVESGTAADGSGDAAAQRWLTRIGWIKERPENLAGGL